MRESTHQITPLNCAIQGCNLAREHAPDYGIGAGVLSPRLLVSGYRLALVRHCVQTGVTTTHWVSQGSLSLIGYTTTCVCIDTLVALAGDVVLICCCTQVT